MNSVTTSTSPKLNTPLPNLSRSDGIIQLATITICELKLSMDRLMDGSDDFAHYPTDRMGHIYDLVVIMQDHIVNNHQVIEREGAMSAEFPTSREQQAQAKVIAENLRVELDAARLLNLETIPVSYDTLEGLMQLLIGLRQRIQDQDTEINQLRDRMSGPKGNQPQEPVYHQPKNPWVL